MYIKFLQHQNHRLSMKNDIMLILFLKFIYKFIQVINIKLQYIYPVDPAI